LGQGDEVRRQRVELALGPGFHRTTRTALQRSRYISRAQAAPCGGAQVAGVRRHQHHLPRLQAQHAGGAQVDLGVGFVVLEQFGAQHRVPGQAGVFGHVDQQRHVAVAERGDRVTLLQPVQAGHAVGPGQQAVPDAVEVGRVHFVQLQPAGDQQPVQDASVQAVDVGPGQGAGAHLVHGGLVAGAPVVGEYGPVLRRQGQPLLQQLAFAGDGRAPVDDGAEDVEAQGPNAAQRGWRAGFVV